MADIKQAAQWMKEGKRVIRPLFGDDWGFIADKNDFVIWLPKHPNCFDMLTTEDLLADDWEMADPPEAAK